MPDAAKPPELSAEQADATIRSKAYVGLLVVVAVIGVVVSIVAWCFLEAIFQIQQELFVRIPDGLGYEHGPPKWWLLLVLAVGALIVALAITRLPGDGGHIPAKGLSAGGPSGPDVVPGVLLAGLATLGFGLVLGPEAPLIVLGAGLAGAMISLARRDIPPQPLMLVAASGSFAAMSFIFASPLIAAVILIEATAIGGPRLRLLLVPGLLAAGIGSLVSLGVGSLSGLSTHDYALGPIALPTLGHLQASQFGWTIALAIAVAVVTSFVMRGGLLTYQFVSRRQMLVLLPAIGLIIGGLAIAFSQITGHSVDEVLFSGQDQLPGLDRSGRNVVAGRAGVAARVQRPGVPAVARELPRRPDVPGAVPRGRGGHHVLASSGLSGIGSRAGRHGRRDRRRAQAASRQQWCSRRC